MATALGLSISVMGRVLRGCMVCVTSKTNGQEVQPEKQQYLQNLYAEKTLGPGPQSSVDFNKTLSAGLNPD